MGCSDMVDSGRHTRKLLQYTGQEMIITWYKAVILNWGAVLQTKGYLAMFETSLVVTGQDGGFGAATDI